ncbi:CopG family antitoxin [Bartonella schoenbuchensis]|uniref:Putative DNA binding protein, CopG/RHH family n=1 Tax=Bartonella schoenbuchensis (strain DSM 13525 / NCTC 13165 / R1) TaxID=687861 RepID=A0A1S6XQB3_BARSR|nr:BrnA antitoxin family protein [Bartonella schoenbuchensis]AQX30814.1 putative DNA binding protein, CopG/RHH family [Bartonella schoenbuchensis R1]
MKTFKLKQMPVFKTDAEAENFVDTADLTEYDLTGFKPVHFEFLPKEASINIRLPQALMNALKEKAKNQAIPYTRYVRHLIEQDLQKSYRD